MKISVRFVIICLVLIFLAGCSPEKSKTQNEAGQSGGIVSIDPTLAGKILKLMETVKGVDQSTAVVINKEIAVAVKVNGFERLRLKAIKKEVHQKLKQSFPGYEAHVTADKKIFHQLQQLEKETGGAKEKSLADILKKFDKINKGMQG